MNAEIVNINGTKAAVIDAAAVVISDGQTALDLIADLDYHHDCHTLIINKAGLCEAFFKLATGAAGEVTQKFVNYGCRLVIFGDFSRYVSKPLQDYIYECNTGRHINFAATKEAALALL